MYRAFSWSADQCRFDPSMLLAKRNLQMENPLAVALKAKMPRFDNPGVDRPDRDLVDFAPANGEEFSHSEGWRVSGDGRPIRRMEPDRLAPRMTLRLDLPLLGNFALEPMRLRALDRKAWVHLPHLGADCRKTARKRISKYADQLEPPVFHRRAEKRRQPPAFMYRGYGFGSELALRKVRDVGEGERFAIAER
jgi:hypothetical protein